MKRIFVRSPGASSGRAGGFTILEIMIATAILTLGLVGILSFFPVAIHTSKEIVETSTAAVIAESVADAIRQGMRNNQRIVTRGGATHTYFIFDHDGVKDPIPGRREQENPRADYYVLLPRFKSGREGRFASREIADRVGKTFVYPETDGGANGGGDAFAADDDGDDRVVRLADGSTGEDIRVERTYQVGSFLPPEDASSTDETVLEDQKIEPLRQYSFAFAIRGSLQDMNLSPNDSVFEPGNRLYSVKVMVFRGFIPPESEAVESPDPEFELDFEVSL